MLRTITKYEIFNSLTKIQLEESVEFDSDESIKHLALILAKAPKIKHVDVFSCWREREIYVETDEKDYWDGINVAGTINGDTTEIKIYE